MSSAVSMEPLSNEGEISLCALYAEAGTFSELPETFQESPLGITLPKRADGHSFPTLGLGFDVCSTLALDLLGCNAQSPFEVGSVPPGVLLYGMACDDMRVNDKSVFAVDIDSAQYFANSYTNGQQYPTFSNIHLCKQLGDVLNDIRALQSTGITDFQKLYRDILIAKGLLSPLDLVHMYMEAAYLGAIEQFQEYYINLMATNPALPARGVIQNIRRILKIYNVYKGDDENCSCKGCSSNASVGNLGEDGYLAYLQGTITDRQYNNYKAHHMCPPYEDVNSRANHSFKSIDATLCALLGPSGDSMSAFDIKESLLWLGKVGHVIPGEFPFPSTLTPSEHLFRGLARRLVFQSMARHLSVEQLPQLTLAQAVEGITLFYQHRQQGDAFLAIQRIELPHSVLPIDLPKIYANHTDALQTGSVPIISEFNDTINTVFTPVHPLYPYTAGALLLPFARCIHAFPHGLFDLITTSSGGMNEDQGNSYEDDEDDDEDRVAKIKELFNVSSLLCTVGCKFTESGYPVVESVPVDILSAAWAQVCVLNPLFKNSTVNGVNALMAPLVPGATLRLRMGATRNVRGEEWIIAQGCTDSITNNRHVATMPSTRAVCKYMLSQLSMQVQLLQVVQQQLKYVYFQLQEEAVIKGEGHTGPRVHAHTDQALFRLIRKHMSKASDAKVLGIAGNPYHDYSLVTLERQYGGNPQHAQNFKGVYVDGWVMLHQDEVTACRELDSMTLPSIHVSQTELSLDEVQAQALNYINTTGEWEDKGITHGSIIPAVVSATAPVIVIPEVVDSTKILLSKPATRNSTHPRDKADKQVLTPHSAAAATTTTAVPVVAANATTTTTSTTTTTTTTTTPAAAQSTTKEEPAPQAIVTTADAGLSLSVLQHQHAGLANSGLSAFAQSSDLAPREQMRSFGDMLFLPTVFSRHNHVFGGKRKTSVRDDKPGVEKPNDLYNCEGTVPQLLPPPAPHQRRYVVPGGEKMVPVVAGDSSADRVARLVDTLNVMGPAPLPSGEPLSCLVASAANAVATSGVLLPDSQALLNISMDYYPAAQSVMKTPSAPSIPTLHPTITTPQIPALHATPCACHQYTPTHLPFSVLSTSVLVRLLHRSCAWMRANHIPCDHRAMAVMLVHNLPPPGLRPSKVDAVVVKPELLVEDLDTQKPLSSTAPRHDDQCSINARCPAHLISASNHADVHHERSMNNYYKALGATDAYRSQLDTIHSATLAARERYWMSDKYRTSTAMPQFYSAQMTNMVREHGYAVYSGQREIAEGLDVRDFDDDKPHQQEFVKKYYNMLESMQSRKENNVSKRQKLSSQADAMLLARAVSISQHACDTHFQGIEYNEDDIPNTATSAQKSNLIWPNAEYNREDHFRPPVLLEAIRSNPEGLSAVHPLSYVSAKAVQQRADKSMSLKTLQEPGVSQYVGTGRRKHAEEDKEEDKEENTEMGDSDKIEDTVVKQEADASLDGAKMLDCDVLAPAAAAAPTPTTATTLSRVNEWKKNMLAEATLISTAMHAKNNSTTCFYGPHQSRVGDLYQAAHIPALQTGADRIREAVTRAETIAGIERFTAVQPSIPPFSVYSYAQSGSMWMVRSALPAPKEPHNVNSALHCLSDSEAAQLIEKVRNSQVYAWVCQIGSAIAWAQANKHICECGFNWFPDQETVDPTNISSILRNSWWLQRQYLSCSHLVEKKGKQDKNSSSSDASGQELQHALNRCVMEYLQRMTQIGADTDYSNNSSSSHNNTSNSSNSGNSRQKSSTNTSSSSSASQGSSVLASAYEHEEAIAQRDNRKKDRDMAKREPSVSGSSGSGSGHAKQGSTLTKELQQLLGPEDDKEPPAHQSLAGRMQFRLNRLSKRLTTIGNSMSHLGTSLTSFIFPNLSEVTEEQDVQASDTVQLLVRFLQEGGRFDSLSAPLSTVSQLPALWAVREVDEHMTAGLAQYLFRDTDDIILNESLVTIRAKRSRRAYMRAVERVLRQAVCRLSAVAYAVDQDAPYTTKEKLVTDADNSLLAPYTDRSTSWCPASLEDVNFSTSYIQISPQVVNILNSLTPDLVKYYDEVFHTWDFSTPVAHKLAMTKEGAENMFHKSLLHSLKILLRQQASLMNVDSLTLNGYLAPQQYTSKTTKSTKAESRRDHQVQPDVNTSNHRDQSPQSEEQQPASAADLACEPTPTIDDDMVDTPVIEDKTAEEEAKVKQSVVEDMIPLLENSESTTPVLRDLVIHATKDEVDVKEPVDKSIDVLVTEAVNQVLDKLTSSVDAELPAMETGISMVDDDEIIVKKEEDEEKYVQGVKAEDEQGKTEDSMNDDIGNSNETKIPDLTLQPVAAPVVTPQVPSSIPSILPTITPGFQSIVSGSSPPLEDVPAVSVHDTTVSEPILNTEMRCLWEVPEERAPLYTFSEPAPVVAVLDSEEEALECIVEDAFPCVQESTSSGNEERPALFKTTSQPADEQTKVEDTTSCGDEDNIVHATESIVDNAVISDVVSEKSMCDTE